MSSDRRYVLTLSCPDTTGIVARIAGFLADAGGWIVEAGYHSDVDSGCPMVLGGPLSHVMAAKAVALAEEHKPDLVLMDVTMPRMNGFEACRRLKSDERTHLVPVVLVTGLVARDDRIQGIAAGCDDFLTKPVDAEQLLARTRNALRTKALEARGVGESTPDPAGSGDSSSGGIDAAQIIAWVIAAFVIVCAVVGLIQILRWMVPGG